MKYKKCAYLEYLYHLWFISVAKKLTETKQWKVSTTETAKYEQA